MPSISTGCWNFHSATKLKIATAIQSHSETHKQCGQSRGYCLNFVEYHLPINNSPLNTKLDRGTNRLLCHQVRHFHGGAFARDANTLVDIHSKYSIYRCVRIRHQHANLTYTHTHMWLTFCRIVNASPFQWVLHW